MDTSAVQFLIFTHHALGHMTGVTCFHALGHMTGVTCFLLLLSVSEASDLRSLVFPTGTSTEQDTLSDIQFTSRTTR